MCVSIRVYHAHACPWPHAGRKFRRVIGSWNECFLCFVLLTGGASPGLPAVPSGDTGAAAWITAARAGCQDALRWLGVDVAVTTAPAASSASAPCYTASTTSALAGTVRRGRLWLCVRYAEEVVALEGLARGAVPAKRVLGCFGRLFAPLFPLSDPRQGDGSSSSSSTRGRGVVCAGASAEHSASPSGDAQGNGRGGDVRGGDGGLGRRSAVDTVQSGTVRSVDADNVLFVLEGMRGSAWRWSRCAAFIDRQLLLTWALTNPLHDTAFVAHTLRALLAQGHTDRARSVLCAAVVHQQRQPQRSPRPLSAAMSLVVVAPLRPGPVALVSARAVSFQVSVPQRALSQLMWQPSPVLATLALVVATRLQPSAVLATLTLVVATRLRRRR